MLRYLGYVAIALSTDATTNRTCRLRNATPERLRQLIRLNLGDLHRILQFDCMLEAKCKDQALFRLRQQLQERGITGEAA